jgi:hypothetical protein
MLPSEESSNVGGIAVFAVLILVYNLALWGLTRLLHDFGVIGWNLRWHESGLIILIVMVWRMIDRAAFKRQ